jgi:hypothetical protein
MKTSKASTISKSKKTREVGKVVNDLKVPTINAEPSEDEIRAKASEIYYERMSRGEHGTAEGDWLEAEAILRESARE